MNGDTVLIHICCAPCATVPIERLSGDYEIKCYFFNPNIYPEEEYRFRAREAREYCEKHGIQFIEGQYDHKRWLDIIKGLEKDPEGGERCRKCYRFRLEETYHLACNIGAQYFATTLTLSPLKNAEVINEIGNGIVDSPVVKYMESNFKKKDGFKQSCIISHDHGMYRQDYCGCEFSIRGSSEQNTAKKR